MKKIIVSCLISIAAYAGVANAQVKDRVFNDWTVYKMDMQGKSTCYATTFPKSKSGNFSKRDEPYFMVTYLGDDVFEVSTSSGYKYKDGSKVEVSIGTKKLSMFVGGEIAWASDRQSDKDFVEMMKKNNDMKVKGSSSRGTYSIDRYSLNGFTAAQDRLKELCK